MSEPERQPQDPGGTAGSAPIASPRPPEPRQRWRVTYRRSASAPRLEQRDQIEAWERAIVESGLPVVRGETAAARVRVVHAAPLPTGMPAEHELLDLFLTERRTSAEVRARLTGVIPSGHELLDLHDVWLGVPPLPGQVRGARYRVTVQGGTRDAVAEGIRWILAAESLPRVRERSRGPVPYDLRPLLAGCRIVDFMPQAPGGEARTTIELVVRIDPELGAGRPDEVVAAIAEAGRAPDLMIVATTRVALLLLGDPGLEG